MTEDLQKSKLPYLHLDLTDYRKPSLKRALKHLYNEAKANRENRAGRYGYSFEEGLLNGFCDVFRWLFKGFMFLVFAYFGYWVIAQLFL